MPDRLTAQDFFNVMIAELKRRGYSMINPNDLSFNLLMEEAFCHLYYLVESGELDIDLRFRIYLDLHSESPRIRQAAYFWTASGLGRQERDGIVLTDMLDRSAKRFLEHSPVPRNIWQMLVDQFVDQYHQPIKQRPWVEWRKTRHQERELVKEAG